MVWWRIERVLERFWYAGRGEGVEGVCDYGVFLWSSAQSSRRHGKRVHTI